MVLWLRWLARGWGGRLADAGQFGAVGVGVVFGAFGAGAQVGAEFVAFAGGFGAELGEDPCAVGAGPVGFGAGGVLGGLGAGGFLMCLAASRL